MKNPSTAGWPMMLASIAVISLLLPWSVTGNVESHYSATFRDVGQALDDISYFADTEIVPKKSEYLRGKAAAPRESFPALDHFRDQVLEVGVPIASPLRRQLSSQYQTDNSVDIISSFHDLKESLETCGCECLSDELSRQSAVLFIPAHTVIDFADDIFVNNKCSSADIIGNIPANSTFQNVTFPELKMTAGGIVMKGDNDNNTITYLYLENLAINGAPIHNSPLFIENASLHIRNCRVGLSSDGPIQYLFHARIAVSGVESSVKVENSILGGAPMSTANTTGSYTPCIYFDLATSIHSLHVTNTLFVGDIDHEACIAGAVSDFYVERNSLYKYNYQTFARELENYLRAKKFNERNFLDNNGYLFYIQYDALNEGDLLRSVTLNDTTTAKGILVEANLTYGNTEYKITYQSLSTTRGYPSDSDLLEDMFAVPDIVQISSPFADACFSSVTVRRGSDILVSVTATLFENCSEVCTLSSKVSGKTRCDSQFTKFVFDKDRQCMLLSPIYAVDLTIDLNELQCRRLIPPTILNPYVLRVVSAFTANNTVGGITAILDRSFLNTTGLEVSLLGSSASGNSSYAVNLGSSFPPRNIKIMAPENGKSICVSSVALERYNESAWVEIPLSVLNSCFDLCNLVYNSFDQCLYLSLEDGSITSIDIDLSRTGCDKFTVNSAGGFYGASTICKKTLMLSTQAEIVSAVQQLHNNDFSVLKIEVPNIADSRGHAVFSKSLHVYANHALELEYTGKAFGNNTLTTGPLITRLFIVQPGGSLVLTGFNLKHGGIENNGGSVVVNECTLTNVSAETHGGAILNQNSGSLTFFASYVIGSKSGGSGGAIATLNSSASSMIMSTFLDSTADGNGQTIFNCQNCTTRIDASTFGGQDIIYQANGGNLTISGRIRLLNPTNLVAPGSALDITFEEFSRLKSGLSENTMCDAPNNDRDVGNINVPNVTSLGQCLDICNSNESCISVSYDSTISDCYICDKEPCEFNCTNTTTTYQLQDQFKYTRIDHLCLRNEENMGVGLPVLLNTLRKCKEFCGYYKACKFFTFDANNTEAPCEMYSSGALTQDFSKGCDKEVFLKYESFMRKFTIVAKMGCFGNGTDPIARFILQPNIDATEQCETLCLMNEFCRGSFSNNLICELFETPFFEERCIDGGIVAIDVESDSFPKKEYVAFNASISLMEGQRKVATAQKRLFSPDACRRHCDDLARCIAVVFHAGQFLCYTFNQEQFSTALLKGADGDEEEVHYAIKKVDYAKIDESSALGCPVLVEFNTLKSANLGAFYSQDACATICYYSSLCDFFKYDMMSKLCQFYGSSANSVCESPENVNWSADSQVELSLGFKTSLNKVTNYYKGDKSCIRSTEMRTFEFGAGEGLNQTEELCKSLCDVYWKCSALIVRFDEEEKSHSCNLLDKLVVLPGDGETGCQTGSELGQFYISLDKNRIVDNFLHVPNGLCPLSQKIEITGDKNECKLPSTSKESNGKGSYGKGSYGKGPNGNGSKEKGSKEKGSKEKGSKEKGSKEKGSGFIPREGKSKSKKGKTLQPVGKGTKGKGTMPAMGKERKNVKFMPRKMPETIVGNHQRELVSMDNTRILKPLTSVTECERACLIDGVCDGFIWDYNNLTCTLEYTPYLAECSTFVDGSIFIEYFDYFFQFRANFHTGTNTTNSVVEVANGIDDEASCIALCSAYTACQGLVYNMSARICTLLTSCASSANQGLNVDTCLTAVSPYQYIKLDGFCINSRKVLIGNMTLTQVRRPEHCMAYCHAFVGCSMFIYKAAELECLLFNQHDLRSLQYTAQDELCLNGTLYLNTDYSPRLPYIKLPKVGVDAICLAGNAPLVTIANSAELCFKTFCEPRNCKSFTFDVDSHECSLFDSNQLTPCTCSSLNSYLISTFDYSRVANKSARNMLPSPIPVQSMKECAVVCDEYPGCTSFVIAEENHLCILVEAGVDAVDSIGTTLYRPLKKRRLESIGIGKHLTGGTLLNEFNAQGSVCVLLCELIPICLALEYDNGLCRLFNSSDYDKKDTAKSIIWVVQSQTFPGSNNETTMNQNTTDMMNQAITNSTNQTQIMTNSTNQTQIMSNSTNQTQVMTNSTNQTVKGSGSQEQISSMISMQGREALTELLSKISVLESTAKPLQDNLATVGDSITHATESLGTILVPFSSLEQTISQVVDVLAPINIALLAAGRIIQVKVVLDVTQLDTVLKKIEGALKKGEKTLQSVGNGLEVLELPLVEIESAIFFLANLMDLFSPASFLREIANVMSMLHTCSGKANILDVGEAITIVIKKLSESVGILVGVLDVVKDIVNKVFDAIRALEQSLKSGFVENVKAFSNSLEPVRTLLATEPFKSVAEVINKPLIKLPKFEFTTQRVTFDFFVTKFEVDLPKVTLAGQFCLPFAVIDGLCRFINEGPRIINSVINTVGQAFSDAGCWITGCSQPARVDVDVRGVVSSVLNPIFGVVGVSVEVNWDKCFFCVKLSDSESVEISLAGIADFVKTAIDALSNIPVLGFLIELLNIAVESTIKALALDKIFPSFGLDLPEIDIDFATLIDTAFITTSIEELRNKATEISDIPKKLLTDIIGPLGPLLDSLPCDLGDFITETLSEVATDNATALSSSNQRSLQATQGTYSKFESIALLPSAIFATMIRKVQKISGKSRNLYFKSKRESPKREEVAVNEKPIAFAVNNGWLVDPRYLLATDPNNIPVTLADYNRAAFGSSVFIVPSPNRANQGKKAEARKEYYLLSYLTYSGPSGEKDVVNSQVCVNPVMGDGRLGTITDMRPYTVNELKNMAVTGFSSDYVYDVRMDLQVRQWSFDTIAQKFESRFMVTSTREGIVDDLELLVVPTTDVRGIISKNCVGCMRGAGCIGKGQVSPQLPSNEAVRITVDDPSHTRSFLALYSSPASRKLFYDERSFGFYLTRPDRQNRNANSGMMPCALLGQTLVFRNFLKGLVRELPSPDPPTVNCQDTFVMDATGAVNDQGGILRGGTFWAEKVPSVNKGINLFGCDNTDYDAQNSADVEHIIEKSELKTDPRNSQFPLVDFVMAWSIWNSDNGAIRLPNQARPGSTGMTDQAEAEKRTLYGSSVYNCVKSLLGDIVVNQQNMNGSCTALTWADNDCVEALQDLQLRLAVL